MLVAVTCTAEDEAEALMLRGGHEPDDLAGFQRTTTVPGKRAMRQTIQVRMPAGCQCLRQFPFIRMPQC